MNNLFFAKKVKVTASTVISDSRMGIKKQKFYTHICIEKKINGTTSSILKRFHAGTLYQPLNFYAYKCTEKQRNAVFHCF